MADYTTYVDGTPVARAAGSNAAGFPTVTVFETEYDASRRPMVATDTMEVMNIPAGAFVQKVVVEAANGQATQTINVGDETDPDGYVAVGAVGTTGARVIGAGAFASGKFYPTGGKLVVEVPATMAYTTLRVKIKAAVLAFG